MKAFQGNGFGDFVFSAYVLCVLLLIYCKRNRCKYTLKEREALNKIIYAFELIDMKGSFDSVDLELQKPGLYIWSLHKLRKF